MLRVMVVKFLRKIVSLANDLAAIIHGLLPKRQITLNKKKILLNCSARIGDVIFFMPELFAAQEKIDLTIITSKYNDVVLKPFFKTTPIETRLRQDIFDILHKKVIGDIFAMLKIFAWYLTSRLSTKDREYDVFFCLTDDLSTLDFALEKSKYVIGWKKYYAFLFDKLIDREPFKAIEIDVKTDSRNLLYAIKKIDETVEHLGIPKIKKPYMLVNVGCKKSRNLSPEVWVDILSNLSNRREDGIEIVVMDNREKDMVGELMKKLKKEEFIFMTEELSLWQSYKLAKNAILYIGMDAGPSHLMQMPTNAILIFTVGDLGWRPFALEWKRTLERGGNIVEEGKVAGFRKAILYHESRCRPCSDLGCETGLCFALNPTFAAGQIKRIAMECAET